MVRCSHLVALRDERGSAPAEFVMVAALLTVLTLSVLQLGLALHVRNTVLDAASEGARYGSLADNNVADGVQRTRDLIGTAIGAGYATDVSASVESWRGSEAAIITVRAPLPVFGLIGFDGGLEVSGHAPLEIIDK